MQLKFRRINLLEGTNPTLLKEAKKAAAKHSKGVIKQLPFTESRPEWVLLYDHARIGQITADTMRYMKRRDLYYLAGMTFPHPALMQPKSSAERMYGLFGAEKRWDEVTKLQGNAARAKNELDRRNFFWTSFATVVAALAGSYVGAVLGA